MKRIIYATLGIISLLMFVLICTGFVEEMLRYKKAVEEYSQTSSYAALRSKEITTKNMMEYGFAAICYLGFAFLGYKLTKREKNKQQNNKA
jgi:hypothetical protein